RRRPRRGTPRGPPLTYRARTGSGRDAWFLQKRLRAYQTRPARAYSGLSDRSNSELDLGQRLTARGDLLRQLGELLGRAARGHARGLQARRGELELLERRDVVVHASDHALATLADLRAVAALVVERGARRGVLLLDLGVGRRRDPL